ncbi:Tryptophan--tRNA ligase, mitochondrial [Pleosporales sp. CAS-2024a]
MTKPPRPGDAHHDFCLCTMCALHTLRRAVLFSGIQPTGVPHVGNYLGALRPWVKLQDQAAPDTTLLFSIADLHALTTKQDPHQLPQWRREALATLLAVGLDPKRCILFMQSSVKQHAELMWILSCGASMGYLGRMTQWKSKLALPQHASPLEPAANKDALKLGLFSYPVLQAADILLYNTTHVPVGQDQAQHLEFTRELAQGFNNRYYDARSTPNPILTVPHTLLSPASRVMSLKHPARKMSKSDPSPASRILINDATDVIHAKVRGALTDDMDGIAYDWENRPGVSNLIHLLVHFSDPSPDPHALAQELKSLRMLALKERVATMIDAGLKDVRERYEQLVSGDQKELMDVAQDGASRAEEIAETTMKRVRSRVGMAW